jgi:transmembrane sensor
MSRDNHEQLIIRFLSNEATPPEADELQAWIKHSKENKKTFEAYRAAWDHAHLTYGSYNVGRGLRRVNFLIDLEEGDQKVSTITMWKVAAAIAGILTVAFILIFSSDIFHSKPEIISYRTGYGERKIVTLADGSIVELNSNSEINAPASFQGNSREVRLRGEAFFKVTRDTLKPFIVHTEGVATQVLGTSFNVRSRDSLVTVTVSSGKVSVHGGEMSKVLLPDQSITYDRNISKLGSITTGRLFQYTAWRTNSIVFNDTPLSEAVNQLQERYNVRISFDSDKLKSCRITGKFTAEQIDHVMQAIVFAIGAEYKKRDKEITLYGRGCN